MFRVFSQRDGRGHSKAFYSTLDAGLLPFDPLQVSGLRVFLKARAPGSGTVWTDQNGVCNGTINNGAPWAPANGGGLQFRGGSDNVALSLSTETLCGATTTQVVRANISSFGSIDSSPTLICSSSHVLGVKGSTGQLEFYNSSWRVATTPVLSLNTWYTLGLTCDGATSQLWINGVSVLSVNSPVISGTATTNIGYRADAANSPYTLTGYLASALFYNRALDAGTMMNLHGYLAAL